MPENKVTPLSHILTGGALALLLGLAVFGGATCYAVARWTNAKADEAEVRVEIMRRDGLLPVEREVIP